MKNKRILISCNRTLSIGGIEKALISLLRTMDLENNDVTLILGDSNGALQHLVPHDHLNILYTNSIDSKAMLMEDVRHLRLIELVKGLWNRILLHLDSFWYTRIYYHYRIIKRKLVFPGKFDCAISFTSDMSDLSIITNVEAPRRAAFIHSDATANKRAARLNDRLFKPVDRIFAVSQKSSDLFVKMHPNYENRMDIFHNLVEIDAIIKQADVPDADLIQDGTLTLCTVGRLSSEKGQQMIPEIAQTLRDKGYKFRWYLVGDGPIRNSIETDITNRGVSEQVITVGAKTNPYPFINACDVYIQPSFIEALSVSVLEAKIFQKTIITTDAPGMRELLTSGKNGLIVDAMTPEALAKGIQLLIDNPQMRKEFQTALASDPYNPSKELQKLYDYIENGK